MIDRRGFWPSKKGLLLIHANRIHLIKPVETSVWGVGMARGKGGGGGAKICSIEDVFRMVWAIKDNWREINQHLLLLMNTDLPVIIEWQISKTYIAASTLENLSSGFSTSGLYGYKLFFFLFLLKTYTVDQYQKSMFLEKIRKQFFNLILNLFFFLQL